VSRRVALRAVLALGASAMCGSAGASSRGIRIGTTAVILDDQVTFLNAWKLYLEARLAREVTFVQRGSYREISELLLSDQLDFAWVCGYPYVRHRHGMRLLAIPLYRRQPLYQSYLIVPHEDTTTYSYANVRGRIFAYSDPNSNSGFLVPQFEILRAGGHPSTYFRRSFFTWAHRKVVSAVGTRVAEAGSVDGYVWETLALTSPQATAQTRIAYKSAEYGFPPLVARASIEESDFQSMQQTLLQMSADVEGRGLLRQLNLDGFSRDKPEVFDSIGEVLAYVSARERLP
jgi:phosphonate transport system substrate-binding protein